MSEIYTFSRSGDTWTKARVRVHSDSGRINLDSKIQIKYVDAKNQLADKLTKGNFTRDRWNHLLCLFNISHFSSSVCSEAMAKRLQHDSGEEFLGTRIRVIKNGETC